MAVNIVVVVGSAGVPAGGVKVKTVLLPSLALFKFVIAELALKLVVVMLVAEELYVGVAVIVVT
jgi:hypothetical protein